MGLKGSTDIGAKKALEIYTKLVYYGREPRALKIEGMTCGHCQKRVEEALKAVKGVKGVQVSLVGKTAEIRYAAGKTDRQALVKAVTDAGYTVTD